MSAKLKAARKSRYLRANPSLTLAKPEPPEHRFIKNPLPFYDPAAAQRSCFNKVRHASREVAEAVGTERQRNFKVLLFIYPCKLCHGFHLTSKEIGRLHAVDLYLKEQT